MSIAAAVAAELADVPWRPGTCKVCWSLEKMPAGERDGAERGLSSTISESKMADILTAGGFPMSSAAVHRHRKHTREGRTTA